MRTTIETQNLRPGQRVGITAYHGQFTEAFVTGVDQQRNHLGGRWAVLTVRLPDGASAAIDTRNHVIVTAEHDDQAWCPECRTRRDVIDASDEAAYEGPDEVTYSTAYLDCGHHAATRTGVAGASPGGQAAAEATTQAATRDRLDRTARES